MKRLTLSVSKEFKNELDKFPDINWSEVMKAGIMKKLEKLEKFEELERRGVI